MIATILLLIAAGTLWASSRMTWASVYTEDDLSPARIFEVLGSDWSPWLFAVALVFLAAVPALFALHGLLLRIVAVLVALAGVAIAFPAISLLGSGDDWYAVGVVEIPARAEVVAVTNEWEPGVVVLLSALCAVIAAIMILRSASSGRRMSSKYSSPAARREDLERRAFAEHERRQAAAAAAAPAPTEREFWDSLDSGVDPTDDEDSDEETAKDSRR
ncbi:MAG: TIGR02234 family membrane protein [Gordonia sp. (in: high G+C Gram-positive bacteria)]|uniref:TIGR02234 family membrane protein n=1 Tax=Gordonia sp. (in: high G+C Gram-positive bacteria) TaxID=84139 RepID=UPI0039E6FF1C